MKTYVATITQAGTGDPAPFVVHRNTLGGSPIFTRIGPGQYEITGAGLFPTSKFVAWLGCPVDDNNGWVNQVNVNGDLVTILTYINSTLSDDCFPSEQSIHIQVYD